VCICLEKKKKECEREQVGEIESSVCCGEESLRLCVLERKEKSQQK